MTYNLFIDDERFPPDDGQEWLIVRTSEEAKEAILHMGFPKFISFDHDLGGTDISIHFIHWLINYVLDEQAKGNDIKFPDSYYVHSQNPIGAKNISALMQSAIKALN